MVADVKSPIGRRSAAKAGEPWADVSADAAPGTGVAVYDPFPTLGRGRGEQNARGRGG